MATGMPVTQVDQIVGGIHRISTFIPEIGITMNQFLIDDERPTLIHTGTYPMYEAVRNGVAEVLDPASLAYVALLHFESDECGGMDRFVEAAPDSTLVGSALSINLMLGGWNYQGRTAGFLDGQVLELGTHRLRFMETPHVHHWDSLMLYEETTNSVFPADLYIQPGDQPSTVTENLGELGCDYYRAIGIFAHEQPVRDVVDRLEGLDPEWMHAMHGGSLTREAIAPYTKALREQRFGYDGRLLTREIVGSGEGVPVQL
jgi:flavorubredoxin